MNLHDALKELKYQIADKCFKSDMDEAFAMGIREGATMATRKINFDLELKAERIQMTKTEKKGYLKAIDVMKDTRKEIKTETGARFL